MFKGQLKDSQNYLLRYTNDIAKTSLIIPIEDRRE